MVPFLDFALKEIFLVQKENEFGFRKVIVAQHLLEDILRLNQPICVGVFPEYLRGWFQVFSLDWIHLVVL